MEAGPRALMLLGGALLLLGLIWHFAGPVFPLGRLPGDLRIERPGVRIYVPIATSILLSVVVSVLLWILSRVR